MGGKIDSIVKNILERVRVESGRPVKRHLQKLRQELDAKTGTTDGLDRSVYQEGGIQKLMVGTG